MGTPNVLQKKMKVSLFCYGKLQMSSNRNKKWEVHHLKRILWKSHLILSVMVADNRWVLPSVTDRKTYTPSQYTPIFHARPKGYKMKTYPSIQPWILIPYGLSLSYPSVMQNKIKWTFAWALIILCPMHSIIN